MTDRTYVLLSDEDFESLESVEKFLLLAIGLWETVTTAPHVSHLLKAVNDISEELSATLTADAEKDQQLEDALEVEFRDSDPPPS